ncbi:MAG TPA: hypothetical protein VEI07_15825 [Planctomycetaceae bacterium]|nr:hypothetical protein [Planctomycetaceae bacterium]
MRREFDRPINPWKGLDGENKTISGKNLNSIQGVKRGTPRTGWNKPPPLRRSEEHVELRIRVRARLGDVGAWPPNPKTCGALAAEVIVA